MTGAGGPCLKVSLRVSHPSLDPRLVSAALAMRPDFSHKVGERRETPRGKLLDGYYDRSAWLARVAEGHDLAVAATLPGLADRLAPARAFLHELGAGGGDAVVGAAVFFGVFAPVEFGHEVPGRIGDLGSRLVADLHGGDDRLGGA